MKIEDYMIPCMNKSFFGLDCLGCGTQRAFLLVLNGDFVKAFHMFPAIYTTILFFSFLGLNFIDKSRNYHKMIIGLAITNAIIMIIAFIYKLHNL
jgi:Protein of unknown function (DUF2752)